MIDSRCVADRHGTASDYNRKTKPCRCPDAREAHRKDNNVRRLETMRGRSRFVPAWPSRRRVEALAVIGWPSQAVADALGVTANHVSKMTTRPRMTRRSAERIAALYEELCMTPGPSVESRRYAARARWAPPLAWDNIDDPDEKPAVPTTRLAKMADLAVDEVAVMRAARGERLRLTAMERAATVGLLAREGMSDRLIAERMGLTPRSVLRIRTRDGVAAVHDPAGNRVTA